MNKKRKMKKKELETALAIATAYYPESPRLHQEALDQGYKDEVCSCGKLMLANYHFVRCEEKQCPFKSKEDKRSLLEMITGIKRNKRGDDNE